MRRTKKELASSVCPFPHITEEGALKQGIFIKQPQPCLVCEKKVCTDRYGSSLPAGFAQCPKGFTTFVADFDEFRLVLNGLLVAGHHAKQPRKQKKQMISQFILEADVHAWFDEAKAAVQRVEEIMQQAVVSTLSMFHDVQTSVSLIFRNAEKLINDEPGNSFDERIENAHPNKKALFKAVGLLDERLKMLTLISNPIAATHGRKHQVPVYKVIDKIVRLFYPIAHMKKLRIDLRGTSFAAPYLYQSFSTIPLVLIDNAIKYSAENQNVVVEVQDDGPIIQVRVESFSSKIYESESKSIYEKNFRGTNSTLVASSGSGLGLYLASIVARANAIRISHAESGPTVKINDVEYVTNIFSFRVVS